MNLLKKKKPRTHLRYGLLNIYYKIYKCYLLSRKWTLIIIIILNTELIFFYNDNLIPDICIQ